jgi:hypothetical protein
MNGLLKSLRGVFHRDPLDEAFNEMIREQERTKRRVEERSMHEMSVRDYEENKEARQEFYKSIDIFSGSWAEYAAKVNHPIMRLPNYDDGFLSIEMLGNVCTGFIYHAIRNVHGVDWYDLKREGLIAIVNAQHRKNSVISSEFYYGIPVRKKA